MTSALVLACAAVVAVSGGRICGRLAEGGAEFKGIPYARPPLGELRWREPQPVAPWKGIREATAFSVGCPRGRSSR